MRLVIDAMPLLVRSAGAEIAEVREGTGFDAETAPAHPGEWPAG